MALGISPSCQTCGCGGTSCASCQIPNDCSNCAACCCGSAHHSWRRTRIRTGISLEYLSSGWMIIEAAGSIWFGLMAGSIALLAFGGDSLIELLSSFVVIVHLRRDTVGRQVDERGAARLTSALLIALIPTIAFGALYAYFNGLRPEGSPLGIAIAAGAVVIMPYLWLEKRKIGQETRCPPLAMDAVESVTCFFMSLALLGGLLAEFFFGLWWVDYVATAVIVAFVAREAIESYHETKEA